LDSIPTSSCPVSEGKKWRRRRKYGEGKTKGKQMKAGKRKLLFRLRWRETTAGCLRSFTE